MVWSNSSRHPSQHGGQDIRLVCDAEAFGYGPASKLLAILAALPLSNFDVDVLAGGTSAEFLHSSEPVRSGSVRMIQCDTWDRASARMMREIIQNADAFLSVLNPLSAQIAQAAGTRTVAVDSLFFMWDQVPTSFATADAYCIQNFVGVAERLHREAATLRNPVLVGPIVDRRQDCDSSREGGLAMVNLGGMESPFTRAGQNLLYPSVVAKVACAALVRSGFTRISIVGGGNGLRTISERVPAQMGDLEARLETLPHDAYLRTLATAEVLVTSPGLTATLEALLRGTPAVFLPPQNYSQAFNLRLLEEATGMPMPHWSVVYAGESVEPGLPETEGIRRVQRCIERFSRDPDAQLRLQQLLERHLSPSARGSLADAQTGLAATLQDDGAAQVAAVIEQVVSTVEVRPGR